MPCCESSACLCSVLPKVGGLLAASQGTIGEAPALSSQGSRPSPPGVGQGRAEQAQAEQLRLPYSAWPAPHCPVSAWLPPLLSWGEWEKLRAEARGALFPPPSGGRCIQASSFHFPPEKFPSLIYQGTEYIWIQMTLPEWLLLRALKVLAPDSWQ